MRFETELWLPRPRDEVFVFFTDAANLALMAPPWVGFRMLTPTPITIRMGTILDYRMRLRGIPIRWQTAITGWNPPHEFVDVQRRGPFRRWEHTHTFDEMNRGTRVRDSVEFDVPFSFAAGRFVKRDVVKIFDFRRQTLLSRFGATLALEPERS